MSQSKNRRRPGGGRKPRYDAPMVPLYARWPETVKLAMIERYGSVQAAVDTLVIGPELEWQAAKRARKAGAG